MIKRIGFLLVIVLQAFAFQDAELTRLWYSIEDITNPTMEEYEKIETYLREGRRAYLDPLAHHNRITLIKNLKLIGVNGEMPIFEKHSFKINKDSKTRCIVLFGSYNGIYPQKTRNLLKELEKCGYSGHVLLRIGGFPDLENGGLKICHVPYAFKVAALREAQRLGYEEILWLDTALHPLTNLETIFSVIKERGFFFTSVGFLSDNMSTHLLSAAEFLGVTSAQYQQIPHISSSMIGLNMKCPEAIQLLRNWHAKTEEVYSNITCWPEELSLAVIAWRLHCAPYSWFGNYVCGEHELEIPAIWQRPLQFYIDPIR